MPQHPSKLDEHRADIIAAKVAGSSDRAIGERLQVAGTTVSRYVKRPEIRDAIAQGQRDLLDESMAAMTVVTRRAIQVMAEALQSPDLVFKTAAADRLLKHSGIREILVDRLTSGDSISPVASVAEQARAKAAAIEARLVDETDGEDDEAGGDGLELVSG